MLGVLPTVPGPEARLPDERLQPVGINTLLRYRRWISGIIVHDKLSSPRRQVRGWSITSIILLNVNFLPLPQRIHIHGIFFVRVDFFNGRNVRNKRLPSLPFSCYTILVMIRRLSFFVALLLAGCTFYTSAPLAFAAVNAPDSTFSRISVDKTSVKADGIDSARLSLTLRDSNLLPLDGAEVTLISSRGAMDEIIAEQGTTNSIGQARFLLRSLKDGTSTYTARVGDYILNRSVTVTYRDGLAISLQVGDLIKIPDDGDALNLNDTAVYYYAMNGKRYVFPNEKVFFSWYPDFSRVKIIPNDQMSLIPIGANITYRPGSRMVKFQTDPKTYVVTKGGTLRWAKTEAVARGLFGESWNQYIDDISEGFYVNYRIGTPLDSALDAPMDLIRSSVQSIDQDRGLVDNRFP